MNFPKIALVVFFVALLTNTAFAGSAKFKNLKGRQVQIFWQQKGSSSGPQRIEMNGKVRGKKNCEQLNVDVFLRNKKDGSLSAHHSTIKRYKGNHWNSFFSEDSVYTKRADRKDWYVDDVYFDCL